MSFRRISLFTLLFLTLSATTAFAEANASFQTSETPYLTAQSFDDEPFTQRGRGRRRGDFMEALNLTEAQQNQLQSIREEYQPRLIDTREELFNARQMLSDMMVEENVSNNELRRQHDKILTLRDEIGNLRFESMLEMRTVLTPEQRETFAELVEERQENRGRGRRGRGFRGGRFDN
jgi:Spy/CpxP family protein refolding chaperone